MKELRTEIEFDGTPEETWAVLADLQAYGEWNPFIEKIDGELRVGGKLAVRLQPVDERGITMHPAVLAVEPGRELRWIGHLMIPGVLRRRASLPDRSGGAGPSAVHPERAVRRDLGAAAVEEAPRRRDSEGIPRDERGARATRRGAPSGSRHVIEAELRTPRVRDVVAAARVLLERDGPDGLTMRRVAEQMGIRAPSLYKHLEGKEDLEALLMAEAFRELGQEMHDAIGALRKGGSRKKALTELARVYRRWALAHPHLYRLVTGGPLPRERMPEGLEAWTAEPVVIAAGGDPDLARATWAFAHGMTILELDRRFPPDADLDAAWAAGIAGFA